MRRLEVGRALAARPSAPLLDEPFAGLGPVELPGLSALLRRLHAEEATLLIIEHKLCHLMALVKRVAVLDHDAVTAEGPPAERGSAAANSPAPSRSGNSRCWPWAAP